MKKIAVLIISLIIVTTMVSAAAVGSGALNVFGLIGVGGVSFSVNQTSTTRINLKSNADIQPSGNGVIIGNWVFSGTNQGNSIDYVVSYTYSAMNNGGVEPVSIAYQVIEYLNTTGDVKASGDTTEFTASTGNPQETRNIAVRLTAAGVTTVVSAPASENYNSTITIALATK